MENKYFTPNIEDIRVGYEFEEASEGRPGYPEWVKGRIEDFEEAQLIIEEKLPRQSIRVPYLTKEQIEAEGWVRQDNYIDENKQQRIGLVPDYELKTSFGSLRLFIKDLNKPYEDINIEKYTKSDSNNPWSLSGKWFVYKGKCKDINTFRYICKLLGV